MGLIIVEKVDMMSFEAMGMFLEKERLNFYHEIHLKCFYFGLVRVLSCLFKNFFRISHFSVNFLATFSKDSFSFLFFS